MLFKQDFTAEQILIRLTKRLLYFSSKSLCSTSFINTYITLPLCQIKI